jgi:2-polyprenyl-6-methoxyphenol hydroxylase-like FAD-dependent oxidoreductase
LVPEIVVIGAGAAGSAAALAAARAGANVYLLETGSQAGGTVAHSLIHTIGGLYDSNGDLLHEGLIPDLIAALANADPSVRQRRIGRAWVLSASPDVYSDVLNSWIRCQPQLTLICNAHIEHASVQGGKVDELHIIWPNGQRRLRPHALIDATGTAQIVRRVDRSLLQSTPPTAAGGLILRLRGAAKGALEFPQGVAHVRALHEAVRKGALPESCAHAWLDAGVHDDEIYLKLAVPLPDDWRARQPAIVESATAGAAAAVSFLRQRPGFAQLRVDRIGALGVREAGRIQGEYCLTADDVRAARKFPDAACRCAWPIEFWHPQQGVSLQYLPAGSWYEIPLRALKVRELENVWAVGKCLSADPLAHASARIAGCCWAMGQSVGKLVAGG